MRRSDDEQEKSETPEKEAGAPGPGRLKGKTIGHTYSDILVHVISSTKGRRPTIQDAFRARLWEYMGGIARQEFGSSLIVGGTENHVHGLIRLRTDVSVAEAMRKWKGLSSGWVHRTFSDARDFAWQSGYGAFSVSAPRKALVIEYDPRYLWDEDRVWGG